MTTTPKGWPFTIKRGEGRVPTLQFLALRCVRRYVYALSEVGDIPNAFVDDILAGCKMEDIRRIEDANPGRKFNTNEMWKGFYEKTIKFSFFKDPEPSTVVSWREAFDRKEAEKTKHFEEKRKQRLQQKQVEAPSAKTLETDFVTVSPLQKLLQNPALLRTAQGKRLLKDAEDPSKRQYVQVYRVVETNEIFDINPKPRIQSPNSSTKQLTSGSVTTTGTIKTTNTKATATTTDPRTDSRKTPHQQTSPREIPKQPKTLQRK